MHNVLFAVVNARGRSRYTHFTVPPVSTGHGGQCDASKTKTLLRTSYTFDLEATVGEGTWVVVKWAHGLSKAHVEWAFTVII